MRYNVSSSESSDSPITEAIYMSNASSRLEQQLSHINTMAVSNKFYAIIAGVGAGTGNIFLFLEQFLRFID